MTSLCQKDIMWKSCSGSNNRPNISQEIDSLCVTKLPRLCSAEMSHNAVASSLRSDQRLFSDDVDIKFSRTLNSYKLPQIRHASLERLLERLTDLRFMSVDFLTTFLLTYRVFTTSQSVVKAVQHIYHETTCDGCSASVSPTPTLKPTTTSRRTSCEDNDDNDELPVHFLSQLEMTRIKSENVVVKPQAERLLIKPRSMMTTSSSSILLNSTRHDESTNDSLVIGGRLSDEGGGFRKYNRQKLSISSFDDVIVISSPVVTSSSLAPQPPKARLAPIASCETLSESLDLISGCSDESCSSSRAGSPVERCTMTSSVTLPTPTEIMTSKEFSRPLHDSPKNCHDHERKKACTSVTRTPSPKHLKVPVCLLTNICSGQKESGLSEQSVEFFSNAPPPSPSPPPPFSFGISCTLMRSIPSSPQNSPCKKSLSTFRRSFMSRKTSAPSGILDNDQLDLALALSPAVSPKVRRATSPNALLYHCPSSVSSSPLCHNEMMLPCSPTASPKRIHQSFILNHQSFSNKLKSGKHCEPESFFFPSGFIPCYDCSVCFLNSTSNSKACTDITSSYKHRSCDVTDGVLSPMTSSIIPKNGSCNAVNHISRNQAAISRVINILHHWITKHQQDFLTDEKLKSDVKMLLNDFASVCKIMSVEYKTVMKLLKILAKDIHMLKPKVNLELLLAPPQKSSKESFNTLFPLHLAEQLTYLDHQIFKAIHSEELLCQAWMKPDKAVKAPHVLLVSKRFNEASQLVVSEIVRRHTVQGRAACIEKWAHVADICCCMKNYNSVLQICAAFVNSAVYRLKKTWEKVSKQTRQTIDRLQSLVSSDGRFKNMRDALHRCDPPCIPYLGMYLTDLSFIEEGTANITDDGLINFSKMRMITQVIKEIEHFQEMSYEIEHRPTVTSYLLDTSRLLEEEETYKYSLEMEPRTTRLSVPGQFST